MTRITCQLVERSETGWIVSLGEGALVETRERRANGTRFSRTVGADAEPHWAKLGIEETTHTPPAIAEGASCRVIFDGLLHNRAELSDRLAAQSTPAANDAELILQAYLHWGEDVLHRVKGYFAILIWDERRDVLLCARDLLGVYPLFYADAGRETLFSTSLETLVRHPRVSNAINRAALVDRLTYRFPRLEETPFEAVSRVPHGRITRMNGTGEARETYHYSPLAANLTEVNWIGEDELEQFDELLDQAVDRCLQLGRAGIFLSGGLDSVSVATVAAGTSHRKGLQDPLALSIVFPNPEDNEEPIQRGVASGLGIPQELVPLYEATGSQGVLSASVEESSKLPAPVLNPWYSAYKNLRLLAKRQGCQVILSGIGGDEWLVVNSYYTADLLRRLDVKGFYRLYNSYQSSYQGHINHSYLRNMALMLWRSGALPLLGATALRTFPRTASWVFSKRRQRLISQSVPDWLAPDPDFRQEMYQRYEQTRRRPASPRSFYLEWTGLFNSTMHSMEMEEGFDAGRRTGMPHLMPYYDADLVDLMHRTPPELLNRGGRSKGLVRQTVARRLPGLGFERQKKRFVHQYYNKMLLNEGVPLWQKMGGAQALSELGIVDGPAVESALATLSSGNQSRGIWRIRELLVIEAWLRSRL